MDLDVKVKLVGANNVATIPPIVIVAETMSGTWNTAWNPLGTELTIAVPSSDVFASKSWTAATEALAISVSNAYTCYPLVSFDFAVL